MGKNATKVIVFLASVYYKIKNYFFVTDFNRKQLVVEVQNWKFKVSLVSHEEIVEKTMEKILNFRKDEKEIEKVINFALKEARENCNFITFHDPRNELKFVQFWTMGKKLVFDFPINKTNHHEKYKYQAIGLLSWLGFGNKEFKPAFFNKEIFGGPYYSYYFQEGKDSITIKADFLKNINFSTDFTLKFFKEIFKTNPETIKIELG